jgi:5-methylcytosine-specific restriction endonuclease McrA
MVPTDAPNPADQIAFLGNVERLLSEGDFSATYKYALLIGLADLAVRHGHDHTGPLELRIRDLGEKFLELYWQQALPYTPGVADVNGRVLKQNSGAQAVMIGFVKDLRRRHPTLAQARHSADWAGAVSVSARTVRTMPLWKLQNLRGGAAEFLYSAGEQGTIVLKPGVSANLRRFHGLMVRLVQSEWVRAVQRMNPSLGPASDLEQFLFGTERRSLIGIREGLADIQKGRCFYCGSTLRGGEVDHFIPWSRYPRDLAHNFVLADAKCNGLKSDLLAAPRHTRNWIERNSLHEKLVAEVGVSAGFIADLTESLRIAEWSYGQAAAAGASVWIAGKDAIALDGNWKTLFEELSLPQQGTLGRERDDLPVL